MPVLQSMMHLHFLTPDRSMTDSATRFVLHREMSGTWYDPGSLRSPLKGASCSLLALGDQIGCGDHDPEEGAALEGLVVPDALLLRHLNCQAVPCSGARPLPFLSASMRCTASAPSNTRKYLGSRPKATRSWGQF